MEYVMIVLIAVILPLLFACLHIPHRRSLVQELIWAQLNGKGMTELRTPFQGASPEQLLYPLTPDQLARIHACRSFARTTAQVKGIRPLDALMNDYYFTVHYDIQGTGPSGEGFTIREDAYLRVCFRNLGRSGRPCIHWIVGAREPF